MEVLRCDACGGAVPLAAGDRFACPHCGREVTPSAAHVALRDAVSRDTDARKRAEALARELSAAGPVLRALGRFVSDGGYLLPAVLLMGVGAFASMMALFNLQSFGLRALHVDVMDVLRDGEYMALFVGIIAIFVGGIPIAAAFGLRTAKGRARLLLSLAARPSSCPGESPGCRQCGAPLVAAAPGAIAARCHYCSADNLVVVPGDVLAAKISATANVNASIEAAALEHRRERALVRRTLIIRLGLVALPVTLTYALFGLGEKSGRPDWRDAVASERMWLPLYVEGTTAEGMVVTYPCTARDAFSVLVALRYGEILGAAVSSPAGVPSAVLRTPQAERPLVDARGGPLEVAVPHSGWFEIAVQPGDCPLDRLGDRVIVRFDVR
jgi:hypothetical protein